MSKKSLIGRGALAAALGLTLATVAMPATSAPNTIPLNTGQEAASQGIPVNTGAHGTFTYTIEDGDLCYTLEVSNLSSGVLFAHIHVGPPGVIGGVVQPLTVVEGATTFTFSGCVTPDPELLAAIDENPRDYYVNVHSGTFPVGEVRGQITH
jgi:hypothetical protein